MNKIGTTNQLIKQTVEHERNLERQTKLFQQYVFQKLESHSQKSGAILQNQAELKGSLKSHSGLLIQVKEEISELAKEQKAMRKSQKRLQVIWILTFLTIAIPLLTFWVVWSVYWMAQ